MVEYTESVISREDVLFVKEDPARIYRGLKDLLVEEFDMDRIEESHMEFNVSKPKDTIRMFAYKEKSPHTVIRYRFSWRSKTPRKLFTRDRPEGIMKARMKTQAWVVTVYPGGEPASWLPAGESEWPDNRHYRSGLKAEERSRFQKSRLYRILVGIWYNKFYSKEIEKYEEEAEETVLRLLDIMRDRFGVEQSIGRSGATHYQPNRRQ